MEDIYALKNYTYGLPPELIAQEPLYHRGESRLLIVHRQRKQWEEAVFKDMVSFVKKGDVIVINDTKVIKARLMARKKTGGQVEVLLLKERERGVWEVLVKPGKRAKVGDILFFGDTTQFSARIRDKTPQGGRVLEFLFSEVKSFLDIYGKMPTPPYIKREVARDEQYQTVYARKEGSVAAPTAGFHFTERLLSQIKEKGAEVAYVTLHCGLATFRPIKTPDIRKHCMEKERFEIPEKAAETINEAKKQKRRIIGVGTTTIRTLESAAFLQGDIYQVRSLEGQTDLYIYPGYEFKIIDAMVTNFHTPCSTNLVLVATFCGLDLTQRLYRHALQAKFRFFSFGDAMFII